MKTTIEIDRYDEGYYCILLDTFICAPTYSDLLEWIKIRLSEEAI